MSAFIKPRLHVCLYADVRDVVNLPYIHLHYAKNKVGRDFILLIYVCVCLLVGSSEPQPSLQ